MERKGGKEHNDWHLLALVNNGNPMLFGSSSGRHSSSTKTVKWSAVRSEWPTDKQTLRYDRETVRLQMWNGTWLESEKASNYSD